MLHMASGAIQTPTYFYLLIHSPSHCELAFGDIEDESWEVIGVEKSIKDPSKWNLRIRDEAPRPERNIQRLCKVDVTWWSDVRSLALTASQSTSFEDGRGFIELLWGRIQNPGMITSLGEYTYGYDKICSVKR